MCEWATEPGGEDPQVWYRENDAGKPWIDEPVRLSRFLVLAVLSEAILGAGFGGSATNVQPSVIDEVANRLAPLGEWTWCGMRFYARDGALALVMTSMQLDLILAAATPHALTGFVDLLAEDEWDHLGF